MIDTFRKEYTPLSETQKQQMQVIKNSAEAIEEFINNITTPDNGRLMSMAKSHLEISIMCAVKGITTKQLEK